MATFTITVPCLPTITIYGMRDASPYNVNFLIYYRRTVGSGAYTLFSNDIDSGGCDNRGSLYTNYGGDIEFYLLDTYSGLPAAFNADINAGSCPSNSIAYCTYSITNITAANTDVLFRGYLDGSGLPASCI